MKIKLMCNWCTGNFLLMYWERLISSSREDLSFHGDLLSQEDCDRIVLINDCSFFDTKFSYKTIYILMEPWVVIPERLKYLSFLDTKIPSEETCNLIEWFLSPRIEEFLNKSVTIEKNEKLSISSILSLKLLDIGHADRLNCVFGLQKLFKGLPIEWHAYGTFDYRYLNYKGKVLPYKDAALFPYKYSFACENNYISGYITEKLWDCILAETLCFYCGAPNVNKFINPEAFIQINPKNIEETFEIIKNTIINCEWEKRINSIREEKYRLLKEHSLYSYVCKVGYRK